MKCPLCLSECDPSINNLYINCPEHGEMSTMFTKLIANYDHYRKLVAYDEYKRIGDKVDSIDNVISFDWVDYIDGSDKPI